MNIASFTSWLLLADVLNEIYFEEEKPINEHQDQDV